MNKSMTILEIIFVILLISIITSYVIPKLFTHFEDTTIIKIRSDINLIRDSIAYNKNQNILLNKDQIYIKYLDNAPINIANEQLFIGYENEKLLKYPIISTSINSNEIGKWIKISQNIYKIFINKTNFIEFIYNNQNGIFDCDYKIDLCLELN